MPYYDFEAIKADNPIDVVADKLGLELKKASHQLRAPCPACDQGGDRALAITPSKGKAYCFAAGEGGDVLWLVAHVQKHSVKEAAEWLSGPTVPEERTVKKERPKPSEGFQPLDYLEPEHEAVEAIGLCPTLAAKIGAGYAPRGLHRGLVAIPVRDATGTLLGYVGASELRLPKDFQAR